MSSNEESSMWDFAPHPDQKIDHYVTWHVSRDTHHPADSERLHSVTIHGLQHIRHEAVIMVCVEDADCYQGVYTTPSFYEPWEVETIIVRPIMKCWGRGLSLKRGAKHA